MGADREEPWLDFGALIELGKLTLKGNEYVLANVVQISTAHTEPLQREPNEPGALCIDRFQGRWIGLLGVQTRFVVWG